MESCWMNKSETQFAIGVIYLLVVLPVILERWNGTGVFLDRSKRTNGRNISGGKKKKMDNRTISFQGGSPDVSAHSSLQENEAPQGLDILPRVDTGWPIDGDWKQRQNCQIDALQRRYIKSRR